MKQLGQLLIAFLLLTGTIELEAQEVITVTGGNATGTGGSVSFTVGQVAYTVSFGTIGSVNQGVQQPYEIFEVTGIEGAKGLGLEFKVYPNPSSDLLTLKVESCELENLTYQLFDVNGILLQNYIIVSKETAIQTGNLTPGAYYISICDKNKEVKTFKIVKN